MTGCLYCIKHGFEGTILGTFGNMHLYELITGNRAIPLTFRYSIITKRILWPFILCRATRKKKKYGKVVTLGENILYCRVGESSL